MGPLGSSVAPKQGLKPNEGPLTFFLDKAESLSVWNKEEGLSPLRQIFEDSHMRELNRRLSSSDRLSIGPSRKPSPFANLLRCRFGYESLVLWRECPSRKWLCAFVPLGPGYKTFFSFTGITKEIFLLKIADGWIRTPVVWCRKQPLCQLCQNHRPWYKLFCHLNMKLSNLSGSLKICTLRIGYIANCFYLLVVNLWHFIRCLVHIAPTPVQ